MPPADAAPAAVPGDPSHAAPPPRLRFDRNELAGAFGDIGTDLPLLIGLIAAAKLDVSSVLVTFGAMQVLTALRYRIPMPVQPLKAMAVLVIAQKLPGNLLYGGGLAIGIVMLALTLTGALDLLGRVIPRAVVRGLQLGLGIQLALLAARDYMRADGAPGYALAAVAGVIILALRGNRRFPAALPVLALGVVYALALKLAPSDLTHVFGFSLPAPRVPQPADVLAGFVALAIPQIPLSLGNALLATRQVSHDLFPSRGIRMRTLGFTYAAMNLINPWLGGVPTCHGSGGMVGHYTFGARTGGSVMIYGALYLVLGMFFAGGFSRVVEVFPMPILGVLLFFEGVGLALLTRDAASSARDLFIVLVVGMLAAGLPNGFLVGLVVGTALHYLPARNA